MDTLQIGLQTYPGASAPVTAERLINCFAEAAPNGALAPVYLRRVPGLRPFCSDLAGAVRAMRFWQGVLYVVAGSNLYSIDGTGRATVIGSVASGDASIVSDFATLVVRAGKNAYTYDGTTFAQVTDADLPPVSWVDVLDQRTLYGEANTGKFYWSDIGDPSSVQTLAFATAESAPDNVVRGIVQRRELYLLGESTIEVWYSTGDNDAAFLRSQGGVIERGCIAPDSVVREDNSIFWLADDRTVRRMTGVTPQRVSTHAIEAELRKAATVTDVSALSYTYDGHVCYAMHVPSLSRTYIYDITTQLWHERRTWPASQWRGNAAAVGYGAQTFIGDGQAGNVFVLSGDTYTEDGNILEFSVRTSPIHAARTRIIMDELEVLMESGVGIETGQGSDPQAMCRFSDDGGRTFGSSVYRGIGKIGQYRYRARWAGCGSFYSRTIEIAVTDPVPVTVIALYARLRGGGN